MRYKWVLLHRRSKKSGGLWALRFSAAIFTVIILSFLVFLLAIGGTVLSVYAVYAQELPSAEEVGQRSAETFETTRIYDRTGEHLLYEIIPPDGGRRTWVSLPRVSEHLRNATIAVEDRTFYTNPGGINVEGLLRAARGILRGEDEGGGSSIHQQLVRNVIMSPEERMQRSYARKVKEIVLSFELSRRYPGMEGREKVLEGYLNNIFYGHHAYGVEAAAQTYFGKSAAEVSLAEAAMLVPLGNRPALNPIDAPEEAKRRQEVVLDQMYVQGYITGEEAWAAKQESLTIAPPSFDIDAPHFALYVRDLLVEEYGSKAVYGGGLNVITSLDMETQAKAEETVRERVSELRDDHNARNAATVVLDAKTSEIQAMVGSADYHDESIDGQVNMAISPRQPGSSFKPFTYATAFAEGYTPATMMMDVRTSFPVPPGSPPYVPENYSRRFHGPVSLRRALACSYNVSTVAIANKVGTDKIAGTARAMGVTTFDKANYGLSLTLGAAEVRLLDMVYAFNVFANEGTMYGGTPVGAERFGSADRRLDPVSVLKVTAPDGRLLYEHETLQRQEVLRPEVAFLVTDILSDNQARVPGFGANNALELEDRPAAAKTGTTDDYRDAWTVGYTPQYVVGVWVGNANYEMMERAPGARAAAPIWNELMRYLHEGLPVENFQRPLGVETAVVDSVSGKLPTEYSPQRMQEIFIEGTVPTEEDDVHRPFRICEASGKLATAYCPSDQVREEVFEIYPSEAEDWVREQEIPQPPETHCNMHAPDMAHSEVAIIEPTFFEPVGQTVPIVGNSRPEGLERYWLQYGEGMDPESWVRIGEEHGHAVDNGVLEHWNTEGLDGLYTLELCVVAGGDVQKSSVPVLVDNTPPTVDIVSPTSGQEFVLGRDEGVDIQVEAQDNASIDRVTFHLGDHVLGHSAVAPYTMRWMLDTAETGTHRIYATAYDEAGNEARSEPVEIRVVH